jgi:Sec-independent protein secretion pathway component TatC
MNLKQFLKPDWRKIAVFVILSIILFITPWPEPGCCDFPYYQGFLLPVYFQGGFAGFPKTFIPTNFVIDVIIWYLLSCLIVWIYDKVKKKK